MPVPPRVVRGVGTKLYLEDGRVLLDCISSWWVNLHGHSHPHIVEAIRRQAERLEHVIFAGFTHEPAEQLATELTAILPGSLSRVFFSDDGSTSVEVALKIARQYWMNLGEDRPGFLAFDGAYHGDTFGAMAAGDRTIFTSPYLDLLFDVERLPFPATWIGDEEVEEKERSILALVDEKLKAEPGRYAALIVEPLVQGAGGMRICREEFLRSLQEVLRNHGVLLILDEVMTGFGRTGEWFAALRAGVVPDLVCLAKGLTGGFLPMAVTVVTEEIFGTFASPAPENTFWHGHSYTANPIGCAAALASLELLRENQGAFRSMEDHHRRFLATLESTRVERPRVVGTIAAFDLRTEETSGYLNQIGREFRVRAMDRGLLLRPLGNTVYLMPPYSLTEEEREEMYTGVRELVESA
jgi:adenosylmethionine-8-amino-7-oxononanoate aminotransferase